MSILRKTAEKIAAAVVRYASAGSKEWAEAIANELAYIEGDWRALAWALSGMRVLLSYKLKPLRTLEDLNALVDKHANSRLHAVNNPWLGRNLPWLVLLFNAVETLPQILRGHHAIGNAAVMLGMLLLCRVVYLYYREPAVPDRDDRSGLIRFYVDELSASSSTSSVQFWLSLAGTLFLAAGYGITMSSVWAGFPGIFLLVVFLVRQHYAGRRLTQVQALLSSLPPE
jgi:hypothetical protein